MDVGGGRGGHRRRAVADLLVSRFKRTSTCRHSGPSPFTGRPSWGCGEFPRVNTNSVVHPSCWGRWRQEGTCKHSSSVRTPEAALVSVPRPCRDFISGSTFDAWRRSTRLNSPPTGRHPADFEADELCALHYNRKS